MNNYTETFNTWNKIASLYEEKFMHLEIYNPSYDFFSDMLAYENSTILEIGCGPGNIAKYILSKRSDFKLEGIDVSESMIALAKKNNPKADFKVMDCRDIHELTTRYDGIICGFCLPYLSEGDSAKLIEDCKKLLNTNGVLYLSFVEGKAELSGFQTNSKGDRVYFYYHPLESLKRILALHNFDVSKHFEIDYEKSNQQKEIHTVIIAQKK